MLRHPARGIVFALPLGNMAQNITEPFMAALAEVESAGNIEPMVALYAGNSETGNIATTEIYGGTEGARRFWTNYRDTFGEVGSTFRNKISTENGAALEWTTKGTVKNGQPIQYDGVSILETEGGVITRFYAYFDPKHLGHQIAETVQDQEKNVAIPTAPAEEEIEHGKEL